MRLLHTSDWHLGRTLHGMDLLDAQRAVLEQLCRLVAEPPDGVPVDAVLIAGDVYDRAVPPVESVTLFADVLAELTAFEAADGARAPLLRSAGERFVQYSAAILDEISEPTSTMPRPRLSD